MEIKNKDFGKTQASGTNNQDYELYLQLANDGQGNDITTGKPLKDYEEWVGIRGDIMMRYD